METTELDEAEPAPEPTAPAPPTPETRCLGPLDGVPVVLADGNTWILPHVGLADSFTGLRDRLFDGQVLSQTVQVADVMEAALMLLLCNYDLRPPEIRALFQTADRAKVLDAVWDCLFGAETPRRTYTDWARSSLIANGIAPASVPPRDLPHVLRQLVETDRAISLEDFSDTAEYQGVRRSLLQTS